MEGDRSNNTNRKSSGTLSVMDQESERNDEEDVVNIDIESQDCDDSPHHYDDSSGGEQQKQEQYDNNNTQTNAAKKTIKMRITKDERQDFVQSLEHIITVGSHAYDTDWRIKEWKRMQQNIQKEMNTHHPPTTLDNDGRNNEIAFNKGDVATHTANAASLEAGGEYDLKSGIDDKSSSHNGLSGVSRLLHGQDRRIYPKDSNNIGSANIWSWPKIVGNPPITTASSGSTVDGAVTNLTEEGIGRKRRRKLKDKYIDDIDREWDIEVGDGIDVVDFTNSQLSSTTPAAAAMTSTSTSTTTLNNQNAIPITRLLPKPKEHPTVSQVDVPNAMLLRCWERAVHAASNTIVTQCVPNQSSDMEGDCHEEISSVNNNDTQRLDLHMDDNSYKDEEKSSKKASSTFTSTYAAAVQKCSALQIRLDCSEGGGEGPFKCPTCHCELDSYESLKIHFYGEKQRRGCCWKLIRDKQQQLLQDILEKEVNETADGLIDVLFSSASHALMEKRKKKRNERNEKPNGNEEKATNDADDSRDYPQKLNWQDVLHCLNFSVNSATSMVERPLESLQEDDDYDDDEYTPSSTHPLLETLKFKPNRTPIVLNKEVLECASRRLIDRYADIPR